MEAIPSWSWKWGAGLQLLGLFWGEMGSSSQRRPAVGVGDAGPQLKGASVWSWSCL